MIDIPVIYVAGKFKAASRWSTMQNIALAQHVGLLVARYGGLPFVPHANSGDYLGELPEEFWVNAYISFVRRCDGMIMIPNWISSDGAQKERREAQRLGMPIFELESCIDDTENEGKIREFVDTCCAQRDRSMKELFAAAQILAQHGA